MTTDMLLEVLYANQAPYIHAEGSGPRHAVIDVFPSKKVRLLPLCRLCSVPVRASFCFNCFPSRLVVG